MNFGEKLKQIRMERNLTQPQFADTLGIEQSYLSKLENDKSQPSADMFATIIKALGLVPGDFLASIDRHVLQSSLLHIPEVSQFLGGVATRRVHDARKYLYGAAAGCALGFAMMLAANDGIFFPNNQYKYISQGVILKGESDNVFSQFQEILNFKMLANTITIQERSALLADFTANRAKVQTLESWDDRGSVFFEDVENGRRKFELAGTRSVRPMPNRILQYLGALLIFCSVLVMVVEWRMRKVTANADVTSL